MLLGSGTSPPTILSGGCPRKSLSLLIEMGYSFKILTLMTTSNTHPYKILTGRGPFLLNPEARAAKQIIRAIEVFIFLLFFFLQRKLKCFIERALNLC